MLGSKAVYLTQFSRHVHYWQSALDPRNASKAHKNSPASKLLGSKFESRELSRDEDPKSVWESNQVFLGGSLVNFRACYNNMKKELGLPLGLFFGPVVL